MKVLVGYPKNWDKIKAKFPFKDGEAFLLTMGDTLYNPFNLTIEKSYLVHEEVHSKRQLRMGLEIYFQKYLNNLAFRLAEELLAYRKQWKFIMNQGGPDIVQLAREFSNPVYGFDLDFETARILIEN